MARSLTNNSRDVSSSKESHSNVFGIEPDMLISIVQNRVKLSEFGGIEGIARRLHVRLDKGVCYLEHPLIKVRECYYGSNRHNENSSMSFWTFMWKELRARTISFIISVLVCVCLEAFIDGWLKGLSIFLVIIFTAVTIYKLYSLFRNLTTEKKIEVLVTRAGNPERVSKYDLVVGDIVHLYIGDQVPADGLFIQGRELLIEEPCLTGGRESVNKNNKTPHLFSGSMVKEGSGKMLVTSVGKNTEWGRNDAKCGHPTLNCPNPTSYGLAGNQTSPLTLTGTALSGSAPAENPSHNPEQGRKHPGVAGILLCSPEGG